MTFTILVGTGLHVSIRVTHEVDATPARAASPPPRDGDREKPK